ncbi:YqeG family HAD IIIA-type phosphatase [Geosporobacter ferrireducens]|uniref:HAD family hydrolase n=1 Tax=Geosporobacter ferrireducens TaxID=1424294 RepID=A0A1D8GQ25_9FIRM|nr:YqeG family HAD IIIA-type phosphatase [Geosporobacter ferrireducens]AOT72904.1 HAD family hydrolase [Geosporobacter ferrireducens]MTI55310.1 YqeG family HAD IIIA-type phosphatase [Geosporobacter ferrireducens]
MLSRLTPKHYAESVFQVDVKLLQAKQIQGLIIDIDNTLVEWDKKYASDAVKAWLQKLQEIGFSICLVSNNTEDRVVVFNEALKLPAIHRARKPRRDPFRKAMKIMGTTPETTAVIGDQLFTDVLGGNRLGLFTVLVVPLEGREFWWTTLVRKVERHVLKAVLENYHSNK